MAEIGNHPTRSDRPVLEMANGDCAILGMRVDATNYEAAVTSAIAWARAGESRVICHANVHMVMECHDDPGFMNLINAADLVTPDGMPVVWALRARGLRNQRRVYGPDMMLELCRAAARDRIPIGLFGGRQETLDRLAPILQQRIPGLRIALCHAPPFRPLTAGEDEDLVGTINTSGAAILFVALGCPKQERWMVEHRDRVRAVMLGVGAAFEFHAGLVRQAPDWMQEIGLEWLFRLIMEPRRLWRRYARHNPRFVALTLRELIDKGRSARHRPGS